jgi:hypothetical protein
MEQAEQRYQAWLERLRAKAYVKLFELPPPQ